MAETTARSSSGGGGILSRLPWWAWGLILGGGVLAYVLYSRSKSSSSSAATASPTTAASGTTQSSTTAQELQTLEEQMLSQQYQSAATPASTALAGIAGTTPSSSSSPTDVPGYSAAPYTGEQQMGLGFAPAAGNYGFIDTLGNAYEWVTSPAQAEAAVAAGEKLYYQPTPGVAAPVTSALDGGGPTPQYIEVPQSASAVGQQAPATLASGYPSNL